MVEIIVRLFCVMLQCNQSVQIILKEAYFIASTENETPKGKLYDKVRNLKNKIRESAGDKGAKRGRKRTMAHADDADYLTNIEEGNNAVLIWEVIFNTYISI